MSAWHVAHLFSLSFFTYVCIYVSKHNDIINTSIIIIIPSPTTSSRKYLFSTPKSSLSYNLHYIFFTLLGSDPFDNKIKNNSKINWFVWKVEVEWVERCYLFLLVDVLHPPLFFVIFFLFTITQKKKIHGKKKNKRSTSHPSTYFPTSHRNILFFLPFFGINKL